MKHLIGVKVKTYRNLNNGKFSVKTDKVQGYTDSLTMINVSFTGGHSKAQERIQNGEARSVHAYAVGELLNLKTDDLKDYVEVTYRPKVRPGFFIEKSGKEVTRADKVTFINNKMFAINAR